MNYIQEGRDFKFRFWDKEDKIMEEVARIDLPNETTPEPQNPKGVIVMQYTGLLDCNFKEIYEGDIVIDSGSVGASIIEYVTIDAAFRINYIYNPVTKWFIDYLAREFSFIEVIGNIYENPELCK